VSRSVSARIREVNGSPLQDALARSLSGYIPWLSRGDRVEGPGRENSLASLTNSLSHLHRTGATRSITSITLS
jgi:hypothetical protein